MAHSKARPKSRKRALDILYAAELRRQEPVAALEQLIADGEAPHNPYTQTLVRGVAEHAAEIDVLLARHSQGWTIERMPAIDRTALRIAVFEMLFGAEEIPAPVAIDEAVKLVRDLSTDDSPGFVNGLLGAIAKSAALRS
ncbi:MAG: transcription antitermination factor NusB [Nocardioides sp.]